MVTMVMPIGWFRRVVGKEVFPSVISVLGAEVLSSGVLVEVARVTNAGRVRRTTRDLGYLSHLLLV